MKSITVYTDGSCNHTHRTGGWAAILFIGNQKLVLKGKEQDTTHQRMELAAVLKMLEYVEHNHLLNLPIQVYTDSQYVVGLQKRWPKLEGTSYLTKKGHPIRNVDLVKKLIGHLDNPFIEFIKIAAHQKKGESMDVNREVDKIARKIIREHLLER